MFSSAGRLTGVFLTAWVLPVHAQKISVTTSPQTDGHVVSWAIFGGQPDGFGNSVILDPLSPMDEACICADNPSFCAAVPNNPWVCLSLFGIDLCVSPPDGLAQFPSGPFTKFEFPYCPPEVLGLNDVFGFIQFCRTNEFSGTFRAVARTSLESNLSSIPDDSVITQATLLLNVTTSGSATHLFHVNSATSPGTIEIDDYDAPAELVDTIQSTGLVATDVTLQIASDYSNARDWAGFRIQLATEDPNDDGSDGDPNESFDVGFQFDQSETVDHPPTLIVLYMPTSQGLKVSATSLSVPENGFAELFISARLPPVEPLSVSVSKLAGSDPDIQCEAQLHLHDDKPQVVTVHARREGNDDYLPGTAVCRISSPGLQEVDVIVTEVDAQPLPGRLYVNRANIGGAKDGRDWTHAFSDLQEALSLLNHAAGSEPVEVWVTEGTYLPGAPGSPRTTTFQTPERDVNVRILGGFNGTEETADERDPVQHPTILTGDFESNDGASFAGYDDNAFHVLSIRAGNVTLDGLTITGGNADGTDNRNGGGLLLKGGIVTLVNSSVTANRADGLGGGVFNEFELNISDSTFTGNLALGGGGAVCNAPHSYCSLSYSTLAMNKTRQEGKGGAIYNLENS